MYKSVLISQLTSSWNGQPNTKHPFHLCDLKNVYSMLVRNDENQLDLIECFLEISFKNATSNAPLSNNSQKSLLYPNFFVVQTSSLIPVSKTIQFSFQFDSPLRFSILFVDFVRIGILNFQFKRAYPPSRLSDQKVVF